MVENPATTPPGPPPGITVHGSLTALEADDHLQYAHLAPGSSTRNVILPTGAFTALTLKAPAAGTANQLESQNNAGSATNRFAVISTGLPSCTGGGPLSERYGALSVASADSTTAVGNQATASAARCTTVGTVASANNTDSVAVGYFARANTTSAVAIGSQARATADGGVSVGFLALSAGNSIAIGYSAVADPAGGSAISIGRNMSTSVDGQILIGGAFGAWSDVYIGKSVTHSAPTAIRFQPTGGSGSNVAGVNVILAAGKATGNAAGGDVVLETSDGGGSGSTLQTLREKWRVVNNTGEWRASLFSSTTNREVFSILPSYVVATDASRTTRAVLAVTDFGGERECIRLETDGSFGLVGIGGAVGASISTQITCVTGTYKGLVIKGNAAQTVNVFETQLSTGVTKCAINELGQVDLSASTNGVGTNYVVKLSASTVEGLPSGFGKAGTAEFLNLAGAAASTGLISTGVNADSFRRFRVQADGQIGWGDGTATRDVLLYRGAADILKTEDSFQAVVNNAVTAATTDILTLSHNSTGTPAVGFGTRVLFSLESSTTADQDAASVAVTWVTATHGSRAARVVHNVYDTAVRECLRLEASGSAPMIGFLGAAAVARSSAYTPTNVTTDRSYDANATTLDELSDVVGTLIADLQSFGLLG